jgi:hypothetical protein
MHCVEKHIPNNIFIDILSIAENDVNVKCSRSDTISAVFLVPDVREKQPGRNDALEQGTWIWLPDYVRNTMD